MIDEIDAGTRNRGRNWATRAWRAVKGVSARTSLRTKLVAGVLALVTMALIAMGTVGVMLLRGQLLAPYSADLQEASTSYARGITTCVLLYEQSGSKDGCSFPGVAISWIPAGGRPVSLSTPPLNYTSDMSPPNLSASASWLIGNPQAPVTAPAVSGGGRWRVWGTPVYTIGSNVYEGTVVLGVDATSTYTTIRQLTGVDVIVSAAILLVMGLVGFLVVQANLRPLVEIEETAEEIAAGHLDRRVPERDERTEIGSLGRSLNTMLGYIEEAFHAREKSEAAAHQSEERMRRFIADASHELRTPLTAIRGFAEYYRQRGGLREDGGLTPDDLERIMQRVEAEGARMGLLVEDLLLLARLDQQRPLQYRPVDLLMLAADAVHDARLLGPARDIDLTVQPGAAFIVIGDEPRLRQVIGNLMSNALTHTPEGTAITVSIGASTLPTGDAAVCLEVKDFGPGMPAEQAQRVFERFYRADQARNRATGGTGLGLAIVAALVAAHGGTTSVITAPGEGATFRVALPLAPEALGTGEEEMEEEPVP